MHEGRHLPPKEIVKYPVYWSFGFVMDIPSSYRFSICSARKNSDQKIVGVLDGMFHRHFFVSALVVIATELEKCSTLDGYCILRSFHDLWYYENLWPIRHCWHSAWHLRSIAGHAMGCKIRKYTQQLKMMTKKPFLDAGGHLYRNVMILRRNVTIGVSVLHTIFTGTMHMYVSFSKISFVSLAFHS